MATERTHTEKHKNTAENCGHMNWRDSLEGLTITEDMEGEVDKGRQRVTCLKNL